MKTKSPSSAGTRLLLEVFTDDFIALGRLRRRIRVPVQAIFRVVCIHERGFQPATKSNSSLDALAKGSAHKPKDVPTDERPHDPNREPAAGGCAPTRPANSITPTVLGCALGLCPTATLAVPKAVAMLLRKASRIHADHL